LLILILLFLLVVAFFLFVVYSVLEEKYGVLFNKPFYVHFYPNIKSLSANHSYILKSQFDYYISLSDKKKKYFEHRVATFIENYEFIGKEEFIITDEVKTLIASTSVMLTFGFRNYLFTNFDKVIVYPSQYYSEINDAYHKGEFNPRMKSIVFSWEDFKKGYEIKNDNLNLGIHEFSHVLHLHGMNSQDTSAIIFSRMYNKIREQVNYPANRERLINSNYFRIYAYTNQFEFLAVIIEHYFESPQIFKKEFPQLFSNVSKMLNHKH
jgi:MtfA peptidase